MIFCCFFFSFTYIELEDLCLLKCFSVHHVWKGYLFETPQHSYQLQSSWLADFHWSPSSARHFHPQNFLKPETAVCENLGSTFSKILKPVYLEPTTMPLESYILLDSNLSRPCACAHMINFLCFFFKPEKGKPMHLAAPSSTHGVNCHLALKGLGSAKLVATKKLSTSCGTRNQAVSIPFELTFYFLY